MMFTEACLKNNLSGFLLKGNVCFTSESVIKTLESVKRGCVEESKFLKISSSDLKYGTLFVLLSYFSYLCPLCPCKSLPTIKWRL